MIYQVGKYYEVPCAVGNITPNTGAWYFYGSNKGGDRWMPVILPAHEDREIINFPELHFHFNLQFVPTKFYNRIKDGHTVLADHSAAYANVLVIKPEMKYRIENRRLMCKRELPPFPTHRHDGGKLLFDWPRNLKEAYKGQILRNGHICPHRGADLSHVRPDANGCRTCPCHGLVFGAHGVCLGNELELITSPSDGAQKQ